MLLVDKRCGTRRTFGEDLVDVPIFAQHDFETLVIHVGGMRVEIADRIPDLPVPVRFAVGFDMSIVQIPRAQCDDIIGDTVLEFPDRFFAGDKIDDGDLKTGRFRKLGKRRYYFVIAD